MRPVSSLLFAVTLAVVSVWILAACVPMDPAAPSGAPASGSASLASSISAEPSATSSPQPSATPTTVWFPPTATPTPFPTPEITPTPELRPGIGEIVLEDDFSTAAAWSLAKSEEGSVALSKNELTIAIPPIQSKVYIFSLRREPTLGDFYAEITASPSLCRGSDEYGLLLRVASTQDYYRFSLSCSGEARLDRVSKGQASSPQPWTISGAIPPGAPSVSRLAVWAVGNEMRFFVNDEYLFTVSDPLLPSGSLGIFARSTSNEAVTVNFSDLVVREVGR